MENSYFDRLVNYIGNTYLFQRYVSTWAPPFDNASFDAALVLILFGASIWTLFGILMNIIYLHRARKKQAKIRLEREQYLLFLKEQGTGNGTLLTFDEWRTMKDASEAELSDEQDEILENFVELREEENESAIIRFEDFKEAVKSKKEGPVLERELDVESIKEKNAKEFEDSGLIDNTGDEKVVSIAESSIIRELEPKAEQIEADNRETIDVSKLLAEKTTETIRDEISGDGISDFSELIENLRLKQQQEARAKEIESAAREAAEHNLEILKSDMESAISNNRQKGKKENKTTADISVLSDAQKKALRAREKERLRMQKKGRKCQ